jgi:hypothetical protein
MLLGLKTLSFNDVRVQAIDILLFLVSNTLSLYLPNSDVNSVFKYS